METRQWAGSDGAGMAIPDLDDVIEAYTENASYAEEGDPAKCRAFATACRRLLVLLPKVSSQGENRAMNEFDVEQIALELRRAQEWADVRDTTNGGGRVFSCRNFRG